jgi:hypothetical protein
MNRISELIAAVIVGAMIATIFTLHAKAEPQQTRLYDSRGNSVGTATPQGDGSVRYRDAGGNTTGTSTTTRSGVTTFYGPRGNTTGTAVAPRGRR